MQPTIRVINKHRASQGERERAVYVGRGSVLGNPFKVKPHGPHERGTTLPLYERHLRRLIAEKDAETCRELNRIYSMARDAQRAGTDVLLMCFCSPKPCHGDVIRRIVEEQLDAHARPALPSAPCVN